MGGWDTVFYVFGVVGILWYPLWVLCAYERPEDHPGISAEELAYINKGKDYAVLGRAEESDSLHKPLTADGDEGISLHRPLDDSSAEDGRRSRSRQDSSVKQRQLSTSMVSVDGGVGEAEGTRANDQAVLSDEVPWRALLTHPVALTLYVQGWAYGWINFTLLSEMPSYLTDVLGFDLESAGALSMLPFGVLFLSVIGSGNLFHWLQKEHDWSTRAVRLSAQFYAFGGASVGLLICGFLRNVPAAFFFMIIAQGSNGVANSGFHCAFLDVAPNHSALLNTITNAISAVAGIAGPIVVGILTTAYPGVWGWRLVFFISAAQCGFALVLWYLFQRSDVVPALNTISRKTREGHVYYY